MSIHKPAVVAYIYAGNPRMLFKYLKHRKMFFFCHLFDTDAIIKPGIISFFILELTNWISKTLVSPQNSTATHTERRKTTAKEDRSSSVDIWNNWLLCWSTGCIFVCMDANKKERHRPSGLDLPMCRSDNLSIYCFDHFTSFPTIYRYRLLTRLLA